MSVKLSSLNLTQYLPAKQIKAKKQNYGLKTIEAHCYVIYNFKKNS